VVHGGRLPTLIVNSPSNSLMAFYSGNSRQQRLVIVTNENDLRWHDPLRGVVKVNRDAAMDISSTRMVWGL
jgi:hypothetical protein